jgi:hypothetical protein
MPSWDFQLTVAALILGVTSEDGFALAGSGAIREHGLTNRPTQDVDLFTANTAAENFTAAVERATVTLVENGYSVSMPRSAPLFARLIVTMGSEQVEVDFGADWRAHQPATFSVGPVLAIEDAVANKVGALYSRAAARDFLDVDSIRQSGRFGDAELLRLAAEHDPGFEDAMFADQLHLVANLDPASVAEYEVTEEQLQSVKQRLLGWRDRIIARTLSRAERAAMWETVEPSNHDPRRDPPTQGSQPGHGISF